MGDAPLDRGLPLRPLRGRVGATAVATLDDWAGSDGALMLALLKSGAATDVDQNVTVYSTAPNEKVGSLGGGTVVVDLQIPGFADHSPIITEVELNAGTRELTLRHSTFDKAVKLRDWHRAGIGTRSFWLLYNGETIQFPLSINDIVGGWFMRITAGGESNLAGLAAGQHFFLGLTEDQGFE